jgi:hypothetical protein
VNILTRYFAGDASLIKDIERNADSSTPVNQMAREALASESGPNSLDDDYSRKRRREIDDLDMRERRISSILKETEAKSRVLDMHRALVEDYTAVCPNRTMDDRARVMFKDTLLNMIGWVPGPHQTASIANGGVGDSPALSNKPITISTVATELGLRPSMQELQAVGREVKKLYVERHGEPPSTHEQICGGAVRHVCSYTAQDRDLVEGALRRVVC